MATATIAATLTAFPATATVTPAPTPTNSEASAAPTVAFPNGQRVRMLYDGDSFYIWNPGSERIPFAPLSFEALGTGGQPIGYRFDGSAWAATGFNALTSNGCAGLKAFEASENPPSQCLQLNSLRTPTMAQLEAETGFWFSRPNVELFRVLWESNEVARCETGAEACEILLPLP